LYNKNVNTFIFRKKINSDYKLVPFNVSDNDVGRTKYLPPVAKEWKNSVYNYNCANIVNYPIYDLKINSLIKSYFNLYFHHNFLKHKYISNKKKKKSLNKIYVSKAEIKHTNYKAIITIYVYNREKFLLLDKMYKWKFLFKKRIRGVLKKAKKVKYIFAKLMILSINKNKLMKFLSLPLIIKSKNLTKDSTILWTLANYKVNKDNFKKVARTSYIRTKRLVVKLYRILKIIRKYRLRLSLNKYKFSEVFLYRLSKLISNYYDYKEVEFNIVNMKYLALNGDIFTEILTKKIKKEKTNPSWFLNSLLRKFISPKVDNIFKERARIKKTVDENLIDNKYKNKNVSFILRNNTNAFNHSLNSLLYDISYEENTVAFAPSFCSLLQREKGSAVASLQKKSKLTVLPDQYTIRDILLKNINYKNMWGVRLRVKGRLTKRYRADRAVYKLRWKGGLKNIDSAFKGLSAVTYRGYMDSNVVMSSSFSKRRIGAFGVKAWFSGK